MLGAIVVLLLGDLLFSDGGRILSHTQGDVAQYQIFLRPFGFEELRKGNLPLWNPYLFSGTPYLGSMQSGILYPLNAHYLFLPINRAINVDFGLHLFLLGLFTFLWLRYVQLPRIAAFYSALVVMFGGATFLRVFAGQVNLIASLAWVPLIFLCVDRIVETSNWQRFPSKWSLLGVLAVTLHVYAGYPQAVFISAFCIGLYSAARCLRSRNPIVVVIELGIVGLLPIFLSALQLWTGIAAGMESIRGGVTSYRFAASFSFPPENLITLVTPAFFGDVIRVPIWGRWGFWDCSLFIGTPTLLFAIAGLFSYRRQLKSLSIFFVVLTILIALGQYTPVHRVFFEYVPGFDRFRAPSKFLFMSSLFLAVLAGLGIERVLSAPRLSRLLAVVALFLFLLASSAGAFIALNDSPEASSFWWKHMVSMKSTPDTYIWRHIDAEYVESSARLARIGLLITGLIAVVSAMLLWWGQKHRFSVLAIVALGAAELFGFSVAYRSSFRFEDKLSPVVKAASAAMKPNDRILNIPGAVNHTVNNGIADGIPSVWGYDPLILRRYARLMCTAAAGREYADRLEQSVLTWGTEPFGEAYRLNLLQFRETGPTRDTKLLRMVRCRALVKPNLPDHMYSLLDSIQFHDWPETEKRTFLPRDEERLFWLEEPLPRFLLITKYHLAESADDALDLLDRPDFLPSRAVVLESRPEPEPSVLPPAGTIKVLDESTDHATVRVRAESASILLVTDAYAEGWRVNSSGKKSGQDRYELMPANLALRAIPLEAGEHEIRMEYLPSVFIYARIATIASAIVVLVLTLASVVRGRRARRRGTCQDRVACNDT